MAKLSEVRPGDNGWSGLQLDEAPLNIPSGALIEAKDVVIRAPSLVEQRAGLGPYTLYGGSDVSGGVKLFPSVALNTKRRTIQAALNIDQSYEETLISTLLNTTSKFHILADAEDFSGFKVLFASGRNQWGYPTMLAQSGTDYPIDSEQVGMNMGDPRMVNGFYTTHMTPGVLRGQPLTWFEYSYEDGKADDQEYELYSEVVGVASMPYVETSVGAATSVTGMWYASNEINSWAYRAVMKRDLQYGSPSPREIFVSPTLPKLTVGTIVAGTNLIDVQITSATAHGLVAGAVFEVKESSNPLWIGQWKVLAVQTPTTFTLRITGTTATTASTIDQWRYAVQTNVRVYRPKEQAWSGHYLESMFGLTHDYCKANMGDYHTRVFFQQGMFELYRTNMSSSTIEVGVVDPGDEMFLVSSTNAENVEPTIGWTDTPDELYLTYTDAKTDNQLGKFLYTNPSQEGIAAANDMPPSARILENYKNTMFWANIKQKNVASFQFAKVVTKPIYVFTDPDTFPTDNSLGWTSVFNPGAGELIDMLQFAAVTSGNPSDDIENMARSFVRVINANKQVPLKARYVSGFNDEPGKVEIAYSDYSSGSIIIGSDEFNTHITTDQVLERASFAGQRVWPAGTTLPSDVDVLILGKEKKTNRIHWSKTQIPGAAPLANFIDLPERVNIMAMRTTSAGMYVVTDQGIWMLSGTSAPWDVREFDMGAKCWAQGSVNSLADTLFVVTTQGVQMYGDGSVISHGVNKLILPVRQQVKNVSMFSDTAFDADEPWISSAIDENNQEYLLFLPKVGETTFQVLRYNLRTGTWTTMDKNLRCGLFNKSSDDNIMMYGDADTTVVLKERKPDEFLPYLDENCVLNPVGDLDERNNHDGTFRYFGHLTVSDDLNKVIKPGDYVVGIHNTEEETVMWYEPFKILEYKAITISGQPTYDFTVEGQIPVPAGRLNVQFARGLTSRIGLAPFTGGDATFTKKFTNTHVTLNSNVREVTMEVMTDQHRQPTSQVIKTINPEDGWGSAPFGFGAWGDETNNPLPTLDTLIPRFQQVDRSLTMTIANEGFNQDMKLQGVAQDFDQISKRSK